MQRYASSNKSCLRRVYARSAVLTGVAVTFIHIYVAVAAKRLQLIRAVVAGTVAVSWDAADASGANASFKARANSFAIRCCVQAVRNSATCRVLGDKIVLAHTVAVAIHACALVRVIRHFRSQMMPNLDRVRARGVVCAGTAVTFVDVNVTVPTVTTNRIVCPDELHISVNIWSVAYDPNLRIDSLCLV